MTSFLRMFFPFINFLHPNVYLITFLCRCIFQFCFCSFWLFLFILPVCQDSAFVLGGAILMIFSLLLKRKKLIGGTTQMFLFMFVRYNHLVTLCRLKVDFMFMQCAVILRYYCIIQTLNYCDLCGCRHLQREPWLGILPRECNLLKTRWYDCYVASYLSS